VSLIFLPHIIHFLLIVTFTNPEQITALVNGPALDARFGLIVKPFTLVTGFILSQLEYIYKIHTNFFALVNLVYIISAITLMTIGYRSLPDVRVKKQVVVVLWGIRISVGLYAVAFIFPHLHIWHAGPLITYLLTTLALLVGSGSIAWSIIRYQFLDIRLIIRRGFLLSVIFSVLIGLYLLIYSRGKLLITSIFGIDIPVLEILFIILALLFFQPLYTGISDLLEKFLLRDRRDYRNILNDLSRNMMSTLELEELSSQITSTVTDAFYLDQTLLFLPDRDKSFSTLLKGKRLTYTPSPRGKQFFMDCGGYLSFDELVLNSGGDGSLEMLRQLHPVLLVPLLYRERISGILVLGGKKNGTPFSAEEKSLLAVLSGQAAIALENARLYLEMLEKRRMQEELAFAREIQNNLLPRLTPEGDRFELAGYNLPSREVGGDYYDFLELTPNCLGLAIGDISGKGVPAAILMSNLQAALRLSVSGCSGVSDVMSRINNHITRTTTAEKFATFFFASLDLTTLKLSYCNAGHNYPILKRKGRVPVFLEKSNIMIGARENFNFISSSLTLGSGDLLILYTDGVTEAFSQNREQFGEERLLDLIKNLTRSVPAAEIVDLILSRVREFSGDSIYADDLTLVVLRIR